MNRNRGRVSWVSLLLLISLLLFKGVAAAAMLCCGPAHSKHPASHLQALNADHSMMEHHSHQTAETQNHSSMPDGSDLRIMDELQPMEHQMMDAHQLSCSGCAVSCAAAVLMINPADFMAEPPQNERIFNLTPLLFSLTASGLERPPRLYS